MSNLEAIFATIEATGRLMREAEEADALAARCPKAEAIIRANDRGEPGYGVVGAAWLFSGFSDPRTYKRKAAEKILAARRCRIACRRMGRNVLAGTLPLLAQAAHCRIAAAKLINTAREVDLYLAAAE